MAHKLLPVRKAIHSHRKVFKRRFFKKQLLKESAMVTNDSLAVLGDFERFEEEYFREELGKRDHRGKGLE